MRRLIAAGLLLMCAIYIFNEHNTRSTTIQLEPGGYRLTYIVKWGWGMAESFRFARGDDFLFLSGSSSPWVEIFAKPYNSGLAVYRAADDGTYYLGTGYQSFAFEPSSGDLKTFCDSVSKLAYSSLGEQLLNTKTSVIENVIDPGARSLFNYIEADQQSEVVSARPPNSKYYLNLKYIGKFGLVRSGGRGDQIRFVPADNAPEPRMALNPNCG